MKCGQAPGCLRSDDSKSEQVTWKKCIPKTLNRQAMVTQVVRFQHAEISVPSSAVSVSYSSHFLTVLPFVSSFHCF